MHFVAQKLPNQNGSVTTQPFLTTEWLKAWMSIISLCNPLSAAGAVCQPGIVIPCTETKQKYRYTCSCTRWHPLYLNGAMLITVMSLFVAYLYFFILSISIPSQDLFQPGNILRLIPRADPSNLPIWVGSKKLHGKGTFHSSNSEIKELVLGLLLRICW